MIELVISRYSMDAGGIFFWLAILLPVIILYIGWRYFTYENKALRIIVSIMFAALVGFICFMLSVYFAFSDYT